PEGWIIASYGGKSDSCQVFVKQIKEVRLDKDTLVTDSLRNVRFSVQTLGIDDQLLSIEPAEYSWSVSDPSAGTIDGDGWFRGQTSGHTVLYVSYSDFYDSAAIKIECGHEYMKVEKFHDPATWSVDYTSLENVALDTMTTSIGLKVLNADYSYLCNTPGPSLSLGKPLNVYGLPDSLWFELETGGDSIRPSFRIMKHGGEEIWLEGPTVSSSIPVLTGLPATFDNINDYPLTITALRFDVVNTDQSCQAGETINGKLRIWKIIASYPGHEAFYADEADNTAVLPVENDNLLVYPNPSDQLVKVTVPRDFTGRKTRLFVYRTDGTLQLNMVINDRTTEIDVSQWPSAIYLVRFINGHSVFHGRIVVE
ncbi:MAG TPA: T9SS type A sorting domain-containing protein, partial [Bacteroidales bacterium]|nr:T9SS type A sorting domain-containing protein [Bacteroidales bacterium]